MLPESEKALVSVIIPSYNYAKYLDARIESILNQTYTNIELIIIDDCSPDNSVEVLKKYEGHPNIQLVLRSKNEGWISANNEGASLAQGEFVLIAQCDDMCDLTLVARLMGAMQANPSVGLAFCRSLLVNSAGETIREDFADRSPSFQAVCSQDVLIDKHQMSMFLFDACVIPNLSAVLIRKECFETMGLFSSEYQVCSDWDWYFRIAVKYDVAYVAEPLNYFMQHETTIRSSTKDKVIIEEYLRLLLTYMNNVSLSHSQRWQVRRRAMELWATHIIAPSWAGLANFPYHFARVLRLDYVSLSAMPFALLARMGVVIKKILRRS